MNRMLYYIIKYRNSAIYSVLLLLITIVVCVYADDEILILGYYGVVVFPALAIIMLILSCFVYILGIDTSDVNIFETWFVGIDADICYIVFPYLILACSILSYRIICHSNKDSTFMPLLLLHYLHLLSLYSSIIIYIWSVSGDVFRLMYEKSMNKIIVSIIVFITYTIIWYMRARNLER